MFDSLKNLHCFGSTQKWILICVAVIFVCCDTNNTDLRWALEFSGKNRAELERVLTYYKYDSEKLQAAKYLIINMPHYYSYIDPRLDTLKQVQSLLKNNYQKTDSLTAKWEGTSYKSFLKVYDSHCITADYLIKNIEQAFTQWKTKPWNKNLAFDEFCELLLPYRIGDEPLEEWRRMYTNQYEPILDSLYEGRDIVEAVAHLGEFLKCEPFLYIPDLKLPHMGASFLLKNRVGTCKDVCDFTIYLMRSLGIPVAVDAFRRRAAHSWTVLKDTTGRFEPFWLDNYQGKIIERGATDGRLKGKVFRNCFAVQSISNSGAPVFTKDVTADYFGHNQIEMSIDKQLSKQPIYLSIYDRGWYPVDIALTNRGRVIFHDLEPGMIYMLLNQNMQEVSYPFSINPNGIKHIYTPQIDTLAEVSLRRKVSFWNRIREHLNETTGSCIELSNDISFKERCLVSKMKSTTQFYNYIYPDITKKYRFMRYSADSSHVLQMAELWIYDTLKSRERIALHVVEASPKDTLDRLTSTPEALTDGEVLSFYRSLNYGGYITFDMGNPVTINKIIYIPRNDDNFIHPGDNYELLYQNGTNGWESRGKQIAQTTVLKYKVPQNAIFVLRNLTRGQEEEIFFMDDGVQVFR